jgi:hypothetical protein
MSVTIYQTIWHISEDSCLYEICLSSIFFRTKTSSLAFHTENAVVPCIAKKWYVMSGLRVSLAEATLEAINALQISTQTLVVSCPLSGQLDKGNHYLAFLSAEGLGIAEINTDEGAELPLGVLKVNTIFQI